MYLFYVYAKFISDFYTGSANSNPDSLINVSFVNISFYRYYLLNRFFFYSITLRGVILLHELKKSLAHLILYQCVKLTPARWPVAISNWLEQSTFESRWPEWELKNTKI